jgi:hypothetical protein
MKKYQVRLKSDLSVVKVYEAESPFDAAELFAQDMGLSISFSDVDVKKIK